MTITRSKREYHKYRIRYTHSSKHLWRLMKLRKKKKGAGTEWICIAIGTGKKNAKALQAKLPH